MSEIEFAIDVKVGFLRFGQFDLVPITAKGSFDSTIVLIGQYAVDRDGGRLRSGGKFELVLDRRDCCAGRSDGLSRCEVGGCSIGGSDGGEMRREGKNGSGCVLGVDARRGRVRRRGRVVNLRELGLSVSQSHISIVSRRFDPSTDNFGRESSSVSGSTSNG